MTIQIILDTFKEPLYIELSSEDSIKYLRGDTIDLRKYYVGVGIKLPVGSDEPTGNNGD